MSPDQWTNLLLALGTIVLGVIGFFLMRLIKQSDQTSAGLQSRVSELEKEVVIHRTILEQNGFLSPRERTLPIQQRGA